MDRAMRPRRRSTSVTRTMTCWWSFYHLVGVFDKLVGQLRDVDEAILMDPDIDEGPKVGDVGHDAGQLHSLAQVVDGVDAVGEAKLLDGLARVAPGFSSSARMSLSVGSPTVDVT